MSSIAGSSLPSSSERSSSSALHFEVKEGIESDDEIRRVPEIGGEAAGGTLASGREFGSAAGPARVQNSAEGPRKRGRSAADKENKRIKRLLRNRVSAQQARERKKVYLTELEARVKDLEKKNSEVEERLSTMQNENQMLRQPSKDMTEDGDTKYGQGIRSCSNLVKRGKIVRLLLIGICLGCTLFLIFVGYYLRRLNLAQ